MPDTAPTPNPARLANRTAVIAAAVAGFAVGAGGLAAAFHNPGAEVESEVEVAATVDTTADTAPDTSVDTSVDSSPATTEDTTPDSTEDSTPDSTADTVEDSAPDSSTPDTIDDDDDGSSDDSVPGSSTPNTIDDDDSSDDSVPDSSTPGTIAAPAPTAFVETFASAGGSVTVRWDGARLTIESISPAAGFHAEIEDQAWDRVRVDFEGDDDDARVEVRFSDGRIRARID